jgi:predicted Fe-Mo cluster-binding NifX family protein
MMIEHYRKIGKEEKTLKFALALHGNEISPHFGHCEKFMIVDAQDGKEIDRMELKNPGHQPGLLPRLLAQEGVECIIAGGIGRRAQALFSDSGIKVIPGVQGAADVVVDAFLTGELKAGQNLCDH